jgi:hypothetical protein
MDVPEEDDLEERWKSTYNQIFGKRPDKDASSILDDFLPVKSIMWVLILV